MTSLKALVVLLVVESFHDLLIVPEKQLAPAVRLTVFELLSMCSYILSPEDSAFL